jgi:hypothetical protein
MPERAGPRVVLALALAMTILWIAASLTASIDFSFSDRAVGAFFLQQLGHR